MPMFRFQVEEKSGKIRRGKIEASTLASARERLIQLGLTPLDLAPLTENYILSNDVLQKSSSFRAMPHRTSLSPEIIWDEASSKIQPYLVPALSAMVVLGMLMFLFGLVGGKPKTSTQDPAAAPLHQIKLALKVRIVPPPNSAPDFGNLLVSLDFPEIPHRVSKAYPEFQSKTPGALKWDVEFSSAVAPHKCIVLVTGPDHLSGSRELLLDKDNSHFDTSIELKKEAAKPRPTPHPVKVVPQQPTQPVAHPNFLRPR